MPDTVNSWSSIDEVISHQLELLIIPAESGKWDYIGIYRGASFEGKGCASLAAVARSVKNGVGPAYEHLTRINLDWGYLKREEDRKEIMERLSVPHITHPRLLAPPVGYQ